MADRAESSPVVQTPKKENEAEVDREVEKIVAQAVREVSAPVQTKAAVVVSDVKKPGLWDHPRERCPICVQVIDVRKQNRVTVPCSEPGCDAQYHFDCLTKSPWKNASKCEIKEICPQCFSNNIGKKINKKRRVVIAEQKGKKIPATRYAQKRAVAEMCGFVEKKAGVIGAITSTVMSDDEETTRRVNDMYELLDGSILSEKDVTFENLIMLGYTLPQICRDFKPLRTADLLGMGFTTKNGLPEVIEFSTFLVEEIGMTPRIQRQIKIEIKKLKPSNPTADQLLGLGLHFGELLLFGFDKQYFAQFPLIAQKDWIEKLGMTAEAFSLLGVKPSDFQPNRPMARFHAQTLIEDYGLTENPGKCVDMGLLEVQTKTGRSSSPDRVDAVTNPNRPNMCWNTK